MDPATWQRVKAICADALERDAGERAALVAERCGEDVEMQRQVLQLLAAHERAEPGFLEQPTGGPLEAVLTSQIGQRFGAWELVEELGAGGMGVVYLARRREADFEQRAALKVVRLAGDAALTERFQRERQVLAGLEHPNVAHLLDGGTTDEGVPYFAMEYVEGRRIDRYCDEEKLSTGERLALFLEVCSAVGHAHRNLVVHRDLKPSNIVVTADGRPKLLDFGIAKLLAEGPGDAAVTRFQALTPDYASPEQLEGGAISTASDVYSLGALLYRLLTGRTPFAAGSKSLPELARERKQPPPRPSAVVDAAGARRLRGDLDSIVLKALRLEPERRYRSVDALAEDLERWLGGYPVRARPDSLRYRLSKYVRRNWLPLAAAALVSAAVAAGGGVAAWQAREARDQRDRADDHAQRTELVNQFLVNLLAAPAGRWWRDLENQGPETRVIDVIDEAAVRLETELEEAPLQRAALHQTLGDTYMALVQYNDRAEYQVRRALEIRTRELGEVDPSVAESTYYLAAIVRALGRLPEALETYERAIGIERRLPESTANYPYALSEGATTAAQLGQHSAARQWIDAALALPAEATGSIPRHYMLAVRSLVSVQRGDLAAAERGLRDAEEAIRTAEVERGAAVLAIAAAVTAWLADDLESAREWWETAGENRGDPWRIQLLFDLGRFEEANEILVNLEVGYARLPVARILEARLHRTMGGDPEHCLELAEPALAVEEGWSRGPTWYLADARSAVAECLLARGREGDAERALELVATARATLDELFERPTPLHRRLPIAPGPGGTATLCKRRQSSRRPASGRTISSSLAGLPSFVRPPTVLGVRCIRLVTWRMRSG